MNAHLGLVPGWAFCYPVVVEKLCVVDGCGHVGSGTKGLCASHRRVDWRRRNVEHARTTQKAWFAGLSEEALERKRAQEREYYKKTAEKQREAKKLQKRKMRAEHPERERARDKAWVKANPEARRKVQLNWQRSNPDQVGANNAKRSARKKRAQGKHTKTERLQVYALYGNLCAKCGCPDNLEVDHIAPLEQGGTNWAGNLQLLCMSCNSSKRDYRTQFFLPWDGVAPRLWEECELPLLDDCDIVR